MHECVRNSERTQSLSGDTHAADCHRKQPRFKQQRLKQPPGAAGAGIIPTQFFQQLFVAMHDAIAALDMGFGGEAFAAFTGDLESTPVL